MVTLTRRRSENGLKNWKMKTRQDLNDDISNRQKYNICILKLVADMVKQYPDLRFHQILQILGIEKPGDEDLFNEESKVTFEKIKLPK